jgi:hypothetical protein
MDFRHQLRLLISSGLAFAHLDGPGVHQTVPTPTYGTLDLSIVPALLSLFGAFLPSMLDGPFRQILDIARQHQYDRLLPMGIHMRLRNYHERHIVMHDLPGRDDAFALELGNVKHAGVMWQRLEERHTAFVSARDGVFRPHNAPPDPPGALKQNIAVVSTHGVTPR